MKVIGLTGVARSGKDTVAGIILEEIADWVEATREGFADRLKLSAALALGYPLSGEGADQIEAAVAFCDKLKLNGIIDVDYGAEYGDEDFTIDGRKFLQNYGTEAHRDVFGQDFWVDALLPLQRRSVGQGGVAAEPSRDDCDLLVIPDVRFNNEARRVLKYGGEVWRIERSGVRAINGHASETGIDEDLVTRTLSNEGGLGYLRGIVRVALRDSRIGPLA